VKKAHEVLDELREEFEEREVENYPYGEWERERKLVKKRLRKLPHLVEEAASHLQVERPQRGRPQKLDPDEKTLIFLMARMERKSNRGMSDLLALMGPVFGVDVSYKTVERLYSDQEVKLVLHNLFVLLLQEEGVSGHTAGDGTGYSLTVERHYRSDPEKSGKDYRYAFRLLDLETNMYLAYGYSAKSEKGAFDQANRFLQEEDIPIESVRLDRYYSSRSVLRAFESDAEKYLLPKKNMRKSGIGWAPLFRKILSEPREFLSEYFKRNRIEAAFSADKRRFGGKIWQKREDRRETALVAVAVLHNLFAFKVKPG